MTKYINSSQLNLDNYKGDIGELKDMILIKTNGDLRRLDELLVVSLFL